jgi:hypothetical protein
MNRIIPFDNFIFPFMALGFLRAIFQRNYTRKTPRPEITETRSAWNARIITAIKKPADKT